MEWEPTDERDIAPLPWLILRMRLTLVAFARECEKDARVRGVGRAVVSVEVESRGENRMSVGDR
jgi:hypothetical protein